MKDLVEGSPMGNLMSHVEYLSETIGPRPATTDAEEHAARYVRDVFESRGVDVETQAFESARTLGWAFVIYFVLAIVAALGSHFSALASLVLGVVVAIVTLLDLDTRWGLTALMPKGPSQNVIARHVPKIGRNERVAKVIVVAHYDSARSSLAYSPGMVKNYGLGLALTKGAVIAVPALVALRMIVRLFPGTSVIEPWGWYVTLVPAALLLIPLLIVVHRELFMHFTPGANDNASGVAAMIGVFERLVPEPDAAVVASREMRRARVEEATSGAEPEGILEGTLLNYSPVQAPAPRGDTWADDDDISWDTGIIAGQTALGLEGRAPAAEPVTAPEPDRAALRPDDETSLRLFGAPAWQPPARTPASAPAPAPAPARVDPADPDPFDDIDEETAPFDALSSAVSETSLAPQQPEVPDAPRRGLFGGARSAETERRGVRDWLGVGSDFDARTKGKDIGSWDNFDDDDEDTGWKGGAASIEDESDPGYAASTAARIRRRVTTAVDRELVEKEVWFVATGAEEVGSSGMKAFLAAHGHALEDAMIINLDTVGSGAVAFVTRDGLARRYDADRRLAGATRRAVREADLPIKGRESRGLSTDATAALARGFRAMSIRAFDINGRLPNRHWSSDTADGVSEDNIRLAVDLVTAIIKEL
jgi:acetylornithine deacetylase/succinyl-diaminopimelate desuccinylase-like protein